MARVLQHVRRTRDVALNIHFLTCGAGDERSYASEFVRFSSGRGHRVRVHLYTGFFMTRTDTLQRLRGSRVVSSRTDYVVWHQMPDGTEVRPTRRGRNEIPAADVVVPRP